ncbi:MAG TPA: hypothetical protein VK524_17510, partial [Polyangiaceae bacterium]|nr:hypothetical protein [Polyangiaceae bacterium]
MDSKLTSKRRRRGAVFAESIIVVSMLTLMLVSGIFFYRLYWAKHQSIRESRAVAWISALNGCNRVVDTAAVERRARRGYEIGSLYGGVIGGAAGRAAGGLFGQLADRIWQATGAESGNLSVDS